MTNKNQIPTTKISNESQNTIADRLAGRTVRAAAPCRIDMGGTLDLKTFYLPLRSENPCTVNIALDLPTVVEVKAGRQDGVRIVSSGFAPAHFSPGRAPLDHPLGLMFAVAGYFQADRVDIRIASTSPPRSALGGSSAAAIALAAAFLALDRRFDGGGKSRKRAVILAHALEESIAAVPCGVQDHLAAAYGGVNAWYWPTDIDAPFFQRRAVLPAASYRQLERCILVAYCGKPHTSSDVNGQWVRRFITGVDRQVWIEIAALTHKFVEALGRMDYRAAAACMNRETALRRWMTPAVLDSVGGALVDAAVDAGCGARFTGAGGGGCVWALGRPEDIDRLRGLWEKQLAATPDARFLTSTIDEEGLRVAFKENEQRTTA